MPARLPEGIMRSQGALARPRHADRSGHPGLLLVPALDARLLQQLAVLLLGHPLTALLDDGAHEATPLGTTAKRARHHAHPLREAGHTPEVDIPRDRLSPAQSLRLPGAARLCCCRW